MSVEEDQQNPKVGFFVRERYSWMLAHYRAAAKWFMDFVRNVAVVAVLQAFAAKSSSWAVWGIANLAWAALYVYVFSYFQEWIFVPFPKRMSQSRVWFWLGAILSSLVVLAITQAVSIAIVSAVNQLSQMQAAKP
jgi:hypothetical protein